VAGELSKKHVGPATENIIHLLHRHYGADKTVLFLDAVQNLLRNFLEDQGFSVGIRDALPPASKTRKKPILQHAVFKTELEAMVTLGKEMAEIGQNIMTHNHRRNAFSMMVTAGSKGNQINLTQISGIVGQQAINGARLNNDYTDRTLPTFCKFDSSAIAKGYVTQNYLEGLSPSSFFFHAAGGREGLTDTAIRTSETGYLYRKLEKTTENISVQYDGRAGPRCISNM